jgi:hypothetical protein
MNTYQDRVAYRNSMIAVVKATRASARALKDCQRIAREIRDVERTGDTATAASMYGKLTRAQRRYQRAQAILAANTLPGDNH